MFLILFHLHTWGPPFKFFYCSSYEPFFCYCTDRLVFVVNVVSISTNNCCNINPLTKCVSYTLYALKICFVNIVSSVSLTTFTNCIGHLWLSVHLIEKYKSLVHLTEFYILHYVLIFAPWAGFLFSPWSSSWITRKKLVTDWNISVDTCQGQRPSLFCPKVTISFPIFIEKCIIVCWPTVTLIQTCTATRPVSYFANSLASVFSVPAVLRLLTL
jgi:hypothetical protein